MPEYLTLASDNSSLPRREVEEAGKIAFKFFVAHTEPCLNPLTFLSYAIRQYDYLSLDADLRRKLTASGFLMHGEKSTLKNRLRLPGRVAVSLVVPELEYGKVVGEYLEEPFREIEVLRPWYDEVATPPRKPDELVSWKRLG